MKTNLAFLLIFVCMTANQLHSFSVHRKQIKPDVETYNSTDDALTPFTLTNVTEEEENGTCNFVQVIPTSAKVSILPSEVPTFWCVCSAHNNGSVGCPEWHIIDGQSNDTSVVVKSHRPTKDICFTNMTIHDGRSFPESGKLFMYIECHAGATIESRKIQRIKAGIGEICIEDRDCLSEEQKCLSYPFSFRTCQCPALTPAYVNGSCYPAVRPSGICNYTQQCEAGDTNSYCLFGDSKNHTVGRCVCIFGFGSTRDSCAPRPYIPPTFPIPHIPPPRTNYTPHYAVGGVCFFAVFGGAARCCTVSRKRSNLGARSNSRSPLVAGASSAAPVRDDPPSYDQVTSGHPKYYPNKASATSIQNP